MARCLILDKSMTVVSTEKLWPVFTLNNNCFCSCASFKKMWWILGLHSKVNRNVSLFCGVNQTSFSHSLDRLHNFATDGSKVAEHSWERTWRTAGRESWISVCMWVNKWIVHRRCRPTWTTTKNLGMSHIPTHTYTHTNTVCTSICQADEVSGSLHHVGTVTQVFLASTPPNSTWQSCAPTIPTLSH